MTDDAKQIEEVAEEVAPRRDVVLNGEYRFKVDGKGRVSLPAKFRKVLSTQLVVARDLDNECLYVFETPDFEAWITKLFDSFVEKKHPTKRECRHIMLKLKSLAKDVEVDKTGRIMLPADAREKCGIDKDVVVIALQHQSIRDHGTRSITTRSDRRRRYLDVTRPCGVRPAETGNDKRISAHTGPVAESASDSNLLQTQHMFVDATLRRAGIPSVMKRLG